MSTGRPGPEYARTLVGADPNDPRIKGLAWVRPGSRVLEVGCGHGAVTRLLSGTLGCRVVAADMNPACAASVGTAAERFVVGDVTRAEVQAQLGGGFDSILLMDVLEHIADPGAALRALTGLLAPEGQFVITLPNVAVWHVRLPLLLGRFEYADSGTLDRTHLRFFTPSTARALVREADLELLEAKHTWNVPYLGAVMSASLVAEAEDLDAKVKRRFPRFSRAVSGALRAQHRLNEAGWIGALDTVGTVVARTAPSLWTNHVVLRARPAQSGQDGRSRSPSA